MKPKILAIIPARAGSKRLPKKHIKMLCGKSLIEWTIDQAQKSKLIDRLVVNTDDPDVKEIARRKYVVVYDRKKSLAQDNSSIYDVIFDQLEKENKEYGIEPCYRCYQWPCKCKEGPLMEKEKGYDIIVLLEPTSPLRKDDDIDRAIQKFLDSGKDSLVSIGRVNLEAPNCYFPYGLLYVSKIEALKKYKTFYQQKMDFYLIENWQCYEIDNLIDFIKIEAIMKNKLNGKI